MSRQWSVFDEDEDGFQLVGEDSLSSSSDSLWTSHTTPSTATTTTTTQSTRVSSSHSTRSSLASSRVAPQDTPRPSFANPSRARESYLASLRRAFARPGNATPSPPPPPSSRRASSSSDSSLEAPDLDTLGGLFRAALSFGDECDRRAATARTVTELPLASAYNHRATWGSAFGRSGRRRAGRRRSSGGSSDEESGRTPFLSNPLGFPAVLDALFGRRRKH